MKKIIGIALCLAIAVSLIGCNVQPRMGSGDTVIATSQSNEHEILLRDYLYFLGSMRSQNENMINQMFGMTLSPEDFADYWSEPAGDDGLTMFDSLKESALLEAQDNAILYSIARERGFSYDRENIAWIREVVSQTVMSLNSPEKTGERVFYEFNYVTPDEIIESFKLLGTVDALRLSIHEDISISDADIRAFYDESDVEDLRSLTIAHILLTFDEEAEDEDANRKEVMELAEELLAKIEAGEDFGLLVAMHTQDQGSMNNEGQYIITRNTGFVPEFLEWTLAAEVGDLGIVETDHGIHIMNLVHRDSFEDMLVPRTTFDGELPDMETFVRSDLFSAEIQRLLEENQVNWVIDTELFDSIAFDIYARSGRR